MKNNTIVNLFLFPILFLLLTSCTRGVIGNTEYVLVNTRTLNVIEEIALNTPVSKCEPSSTNVRFFGTNKEVLAKTCIDGKCEDTRVESLSFFERGGAQVEPAQIAFESVTDPAAGPVTPVEDDNGLLWLCRKTKEGNCICIPWAQD